MIYSRLALGTALCIAALATSVNAQQVHPTRGQNAATQASDEADCSQWATRQSGYDPSRPPPPVTASPAPVTGSGARVRGAAAGAVIAGVTGGDAGEGAAAGAVVGGIARRGANRRAAAAQNQAAQAPQAAWVQARGACLSSRGYTLD